MTKAHTLLGVVAASTIAGAAAAEATIEFENFIASGAQFFQIDGTLDALTGELTGATGDFVMNADGENFTWCDDFCVLIANSDLTALHVQIGGFSDFGATHRATWTDGASGDAGTQGGGAAVGLEGPIDVTGWTLWIGNGYGSGGNGDWSGSVDLEGSIELPAPGALALLGLSGLVARRRRG